MSLTKKDIAQPDKHSQPKSAKMQFFQLCPKCGAKIGVLSGSVSAICTVCGYKDPCCE